MSSEHRTDVAVVGAGPVGLFTIFECGMLDLRCHVIDALDMPGGQCAALYPEKPIYDIPGYPKIAAQELISQLERQAKPFKPVYHLGQRVDSLTAADDGFTLVTSLGTRIEAKAVVIAAGVGAFGPNRPPLKGIEEFEGKGVFYLVRRREDFRGKRVVIAGGGDSAVDWALSLAELTDRLYVVHRRDKFRAAPESERRLRQLAADGRLELVIPYHLAALGGKDGRLSTVVVKTLDGVERALEADALLSFFGLAMSLGPIADWGLALERSHLTVDPATLASSVKGIYAVGDIVTYPGKLKLILTGFAEAAAAAHAIQAFVRPDKPLHFEYSTTRGVPGVA
ncbi:MAG: NAD(P)/FAD-dependent oxidoreductase [Rhodospirillaceae bacterium]|nr:NAD(P)/FAD-dependent oxidoreductase [Rhodospirillaceae bacterium]